MNTALNALLIGVAGACGAICRYGLNGIATHPGLQGLAGGSPYLGTLLANCLGCALLGGVAEWLLIAAIQPETGQERLFLAIRIGFLGSLTTFSTLIGESLQLSGSGRLAAGVGLLLVNTITGIVLFLGTGYLVRSWAG
ncbi:MAG: CrcB family protein [Planctomycetota bacterium]